jgi:5'-nucleotidase
MIVDPIAQGVQRYSIVRKAGPARLGTLSNLVKILLSNDDGYQAEGLTALTLAIKPLGSVTVVAPDRNRSGASNSLTLDVPVRATTYALDSYHCNGTPTDCVHLAISGLFDFEHDIVVSGVNDGANLGDDTLYSGTVAAAVEGRFLGLPAIAISLCVEPGSPRNFTAAAQVAVRLVERLSRSPLQESVILNVNVPDLPEGAIRGIQVTRLGNRHRAEKVVRAKDPRGRNVYWVGSAGAGQDAGPGTDFHAIAQGYVSVTPLQIDLTRHAALPELERWLKLE